MPTAPATARRASNNDAKSENPLTEYVILQAVRVRHNKLNEALGEDAGLLPGGSHSGEDGFITLWLPLRNEKAEHGQDGEVRIVRSNAPANAIKLATKMEDSDAQREGSYKSVPLRSWKGGKVYRNKQKVVTDAEDFSD